MRTTFFKLWVHAIFHINENSVLIDPDLESLFYLEIEKRFVEQGCEVAIVNGNLDHVHILFTQNPLLPLHEILRFVQGISQRWYQMHDFKTGWYKFKWQEAYCAYSVSESAMEKAQFFIEKQGEIHQNLSYWDEIEHLNLLHNVDLTDEHSDVEMQSWQSRFSFKHIGKEFL